MSGFLGNTHCDVHRTATGVNLDNFVVHDFSRLVKVRKRKSYKRVRPSEDFLLTSAQLS